jgi:predicted nucleotide-binding protein
VGTLSVTIAAEELIEKLQQFLRALDMWKTASPEQRAPVRSFINQRIPEVQQIVRTAGCLKLMTLTPPAITGGLVVQNANPFDYLFDSPYGLNLIRPARDMIDQTIGIIRSGKFEERKNSVERTKQPLNARSTTKVFLVHGHDGMTLESTARFLLTLGLDPIILNEQASRGRTLIEKIEQYSDVAFAVVLLTPDDVGAERATTPILAPRARQNVILELGYFMGKLGRANVAALLKAEVERPSDYDGVNYIQMNEGSGHWQSELFRELKDAGLDLGKAKWP